MAKSFFGIGSGSKSFSEEINSIMGWAQYSDTQYTSASPFSITAGTRSKLPNNGLSTIKSQLPTGIVDFYDAATQKIKPDTFGDGYIIRINFKAYTDNQNGVGEVSIDIGNGSQIEILEIPVSFPRGTGPSNIRPYSSSSFIYSLGTFIANGGEVFYEGVTGTTNIYDITYVIERTSKGK